MELNVDQLKAEALKQLTLLGTDLRKDIWTDQDKAFLNIMAGDIAGLTKKLATEADPDKKARYRRSLDLIANHVAVMTFSRLNVLEQRVGEMVLSLLQKAGKFAITALLASVGIPNVAELLK